MAREIEEEAGITARALHVTGLYKNHVHPLRPVTVVWLCQYVSGEVRRTDESRETRWLTPAEVQERLAPAHGAARITDALSSNPECQIAVRSHDGVNILSKGGAE